MTKQLNRQADTLKVLCNAADTPTHRKLCVTSTNAMGQEEDEEAEEEESQINGRGGGAGGGGGRGGGGGGG